MGVEAEKTRFTPGVLFPSCSQILLLLLLFNGVVSAQPHTITIPFESHSGLIFLRTTLDKKPALLLLDTGANVSIVFKDGARIIISDGAFHTLSEYPERTVFRYPDELHRAEGLVGEDILRGFSAVRIDYKKQVLELVR